MRKFFQSSLKGRWRNSNSAESGRFSNTGVRQVHATTSHDRIETSHNPIKISETAHQCARSQGFHFRLKQSGGLTAVDLIGMAALLGSLNPTGRTSMGTAVVRK